jgi:hypothetical protein
VYDKASRFPGLIVVALVGLLAAPAVGQLSASDVAALRAQGEREGWTFVVRESEATALPREQLCGLVEPEGWERSARFEPCNPVRDLPAAFDWRQTIPMPPVRNQSACGSCWAFGTIGALECNIKIADYIDVDLSEQWLVSCNSDGWGCGGGWWAHDYLQWKTDPCGGTGAPLEAAFPYAAFDVPCNCPYPHDYFIDNWAYIDGGDIPPAANIKQAILDHGPVSVTVYVNDAFQAYGGGIFNVCTNDHGVNHGVVLVGWQDDAMGGYWIMRNSWGPGWGEAGYMRIRYECCRIGHAAVFIEYTPAPRTLSFTYPDGQPELLAAQQSTTVRVSVGPASGVPVAGTGQVHYSLDGGAYNAVAMSEVSPNEYEATLPGVACGASLHWYFSAEEATDGRLSDPADAPATTYTALPYTATPLVWADDFSTDQGWTVTSSQLSSGAWERGIPAGGGERGDPPVDADGSGWCYVTGNQIGDSDVDGGPTRLLSPVFDLSDGGEYRFGFAAWVYNDDHDPNDALTVWVSRNGGTSWYAVDQIGVTNGWTYWDYRVRDFCLLSAQMRFRLMVQDNPNNSLAELGVDAFELYRVECGYALGDMNCDGVLSFADINAFVTALLDASTYTVTYASCDRMLADMNTDGVVDFADINPFVTAIVGK